MKTALAALLALGLTATTGCQCFSPNSIFPPSNRCAGGCGVNCYEEQGNHLWEPGTPGGIGCEGKMCSAHCGCDTPNCGIESHCTPGCGVESTGCSTVPGCGCESTAIGAGCASDGSGVATRRLAPVINATDLRGRADAGAAGCQTTPRGMTGRLAAGGGAFGNTQGYTCPNCGSLAGLGGCQACGHGGALLRHAATACAGGGCGLSQGPEQGAVMYPYYTLRGPRDFLINNPPSIGP